MKIVTIGEAARSLVTRYAVSPDIALADNVWPLCARAARSTKPASSFVALARFGVRSSNFGGREPTRSLEVFAKRRMINAGAA